MRSIRRMSCTRTASWAIMGEPPGRVCLDTRHPRRLFASSQALMWPPLFMTRPQLDCRSLRSLTSSSELLSTLSWVLGAVGLVTGQPTAVGGDKGIDEVLQLPDAR